MVFRRYPNPPEKIYPRLLLVVTGLVVFVAVLAAALVWQRADLPSRGDPGYGADSAKRTRVAVTSVHDGDTFRIGSERIRVLGMDAPEIGRGAKCPNEQRMAEKARAYLETAVTSDDVRLERDGHDVYGRTLARVYVSGRDVAAAMIAKGLALPYVRGRHGDWC